MRPLLDTCTFLWLINDAGKLPVEVRNLICSARSEVWLSTVSNWEISVKETLGKLVFPEPARDYIPKQRVAHQLGSLPLDERAVGHLSQLPPLHRDPFDRMLICQSIENNLSLVTSDPLIRRYPIKTHWAT